MGYYINTDSKGSHIGTTFSEKVSNLIADGAVKIQKPIDWEEGLVCVVDNGFFAAAGYAYNDREMEAFKETNGRPYQWLKFDKASELAQ